MESATLSAVNLTKKFGSVMAVDDLSFDVAAGRVTGFLGPNGAGKTTTLRMLLGLVLPTSGKALVKGVKYVNLEDPIRTLGAHLDSGSFQPGRTGRDHMRVACAEGGISTSRINELLDLVGMTGAADRKMGGYSLGMLQRLGLATALLGDPQILLLDEPANGLDPEGIRWLREFLRAYADGRKTVFLSSHLLSEIQLLAHDVIIINHGKLVAAGPVRDLEAVEGGSVEVAAEDNAALAAALSSAGFSASLQGATEQDQPGMVLISGGTAAEVGRAALDAGIALTHLAEKNSGLEDLFVSLVGENQ